MAVITISLGFVPARILAPSLDAYRATRNPALSYRHYLLDQHYPVDKEANRIAIREICRREGVEVLDAGRNLGLHLGFNEAMRMIAPAPDDIVIAYDPDSTPTTPGWDMALVRAILGDPWQKIVWASLMNPRSEADLHARGFTKSASDGFIETWKTHAAVTNSICAWRAGWLQKVGGLSEPNAWYGHLESSMWAKLQATQSDWAFLPGWREVDSLRDLHDRSYVVWKWVTAHLGSYTGDFESWLAAGSPNPEDHPTPASIP